MQVYGVVKVDNPKCEDYGYWRLNSYNAEGMIYVPCEVIYKAKTRKACLNYANNNGLTVTFYENGRMQSGANW